MSDSRLTINVASLAPRTGSATPVPMEYILGYARVSTTEQSPDLQVDELTEARCQRVFVEHASGARADRP